jgi:hypothetical protein
VIRLEAVDPESTRSFDEVRAELEPELRRTEVEKAFGDAQEQLDTLAFEASGDLAAVAAKMNLPVRRVERFTRSGGGDLGATSALVSAVFAADVLAGRELRTVELEPGRIVAIGASAHQPAQPRPLEEIRVQIALAARLEQAQKLAAGFRGGRRGTGCQARPEKRRPRRQADASRQRQPAPRAPRRPADPGRDPGRSIPRAGAAGQAALWHGRTREWRCRRLDRHGSARWHARRTVPRGAATRARPGTRTRGAMGRERLRRIHARQCRRRRQPATFE